MDDLEYTWRLDDDSEILAPINYDIIRYMDDHDFKYGYVIEGSDPPLCVQGLQEIAGSTITIDRLIIKNFYNYPVTRYYYNNFEISHMSIWRSQNYQRYINKVDTEGGIYYHRWGDAPIKSIAVRMIVPKAEIHQFTDIRYRHKGFVNDGAVDVIQPW